MLRAPRLPRVQNINNTQYVACMNPTAGSFEINPRLQRLFMTLAMDFPGQVRLCVCVGAYVRACGCVSGCVGV